VRFVSDSIPLQTYRAFATIKGGEVVSGAHEGASLHGQDAVSVSLPARHEILWCLRSAAGTIGSTKRHGYHPEGSCSMRFTRQFFGGIVVGLALGMFLGAALAEGKKEVNYTSMAGVGGLLIVAGVAMARSGSPKS
jgi:hypothetical protein